ncbi:MAG: radical SAM protein [Candidatus Omnitrophota bacterium]|jgi:MoaA/NifB/PqqE/SkfB family radical SAM enzyme
MIAACLKTIKFNFKNKRFLSQALPLSLTFNLTSLCPLKCKTCNIWKSEPHAELSLEQYEKIFVSINTPIEWIVITGGEPFLRADLDKIVAGIIKYLKPKFINIASCGYYPELSVLKTQNILSLSGNCRIKVNLSIDGIEGQHDYIRGTDGSYVNVVRTFKLLKGLKHKNLSLGINTVISKYNIGSLRQLSDKIAQLLPSSHFFEFAQKREELKNSGMDFLASEEASINWLKKEACLSKNIKNSFIVDLLRAAYYKYLLLIFQGRAIPLGCFSGYAFGHVSPEGMVYNCCVRQDPLGDLKEVNYDFKKIWFSDVKKSISEQINREKCSCSSVSSFYINLLCSLARIYSLFLA